MPSKSGKQHRLMAAAAHNPKVRKQHGISQAIAEEFLRADKGKQFSGGRKLRTKRSTSR